MNVLEFNLIKTCNLNCKGCNHFSVISDNPDIIAVDVFERDLHRMRDLNVGVERISLLGGEPLLLDNLYEYIDCCKQVYPESNIVITTNGTHIFTLSDAVLDSLSKNEVELSISLYPVIKYKRWRMTWFLQERGIKFKFLVFKNIFSKVLTKEPHKDELRKYCFCNTPTLENGRLYRCPVTTFINKFNKRFTLQYPEGEYIDIYSDEISSLKIEKFIRSNSKLCAYCMPKNGGVYHWANNYNSKASAEDWITGEADQRMQDFNHQRKLAYQKEWNSKLIFHLRKISRFLSTNF